MVVSERARLEMAEALRSALGEEAAMTLMEHLPPAGWSDVATRRDLDLLRAEMHTEMAELRTEIIDRLATMQRVMVTTFVSTLVAFAGLLLAAGALTR